MVEVDWETKPIRDSADVVFKFMDEVDTINEPLIPSGVLTMATKCYSPSCPGDRRCYAPRCPWKTPPGSWLINNLEEDIGSSRALMSQGEKDWTQDVDPILLAELTPQQRRRQTDIREAVLEEERYEADLAALETVFITPLLTAQPPIVEPYPRLEALVKGLFGNIVDIRRASRRLLDNYSIRLREQFPLIETVGDILLEAATDFRSLYPDYMDNLTTADELLTKTLAESPQFSDWYDRVSRQGSHRWDLRYLLKRPSSYLTKYPSVIEKILESTLPTDPDLSFLTEALSSIRNISYLAQLKLFHASRGRGAAANLQYHEIVSPEVYQKMEKKEQQRQM
jgi:hypothetical protein